MKIKLLAILLGVFILAPVGAWAQERGDSGRGGGGQQGPGDAGLRPLVRFLELDESQVQALLMMQRDNAQALRPLARSLRDNQAALREALASDSPDEATVGQLVLAGRTIQRDINLLRRSQLEGAPDALNLSLDQREKLELLQLSLRVASVANIARGLNLIRGPALAEARPASPPRSRPRGGNRGPNRDGEGDGEMQGLTPAELEMTLESLQSEVDRIGQNVDRVSRRLSVPPILKD